MTETVSNNIPRIFLRSEPFGGIVADHFSSKVRFFNQTAFFLIEQILSNPSDEEILRTVKRRFKGTEKQNLLEHINICREDLLSFLKSEEATSVVDDLEESVPILKAPLDLQLEITKRCNLSCAHCYNLSGARCTAELPWEYIHDVLEQFTSDRIRFISITGGEPLLHPQLESVLKMARDVAENVNLSTNGTLVSENNFPYIVEYVDTVNISLDAPIAEVHDRFRNQSGSFEKAKRAIGKFASKGIEVVVQTTVFRENLSLLKDLGKLVQDEGASSWSVRLPLASGRAVKNSEMFFSPDEIREREEDLHSLHDIGFNMEVYAGIPVSWSRKEKYQKLEHKNPLIACTASAVLATVLADKRLSPCILFSGTEYAEPMPDPKEIKHLWRESHYFNQIRKMRLHDIPLCRTCGHYGRVCKTECRAKAYLFHGDIATPDPDCDYYRTFQKMSNSSIG